MTPQYAGLRTLHETFKDRGFTVLGFPCNQFGAQEPGSNEEVLEFARSKFDATFPLFSKIEVNGDEACELYKLLKAGQPGTADTSDIRWNFTKFLVDGGGDVVARFEPQVTPDEIEPEITARL